VIDVFIVLVVMALELENISRKTILRTSRDIPDPSLSSHTITNLSKCYVYLLACLSDITIKGCEECVIVTGVCKSLLSVESCSNCKIISISKAVKIEESNDTTFYLCTNTRPVLTVGNNRLLFAPYNTYYSQLDVHIQTAQIKTGMKENLWNSPMDYTRARAASLSIARRDRSQSRTEEKEKSYSLLKLDDFTNFVVPFHLPGNTKANPIELPHEYAAALEKKSKVICDLRTSLLNLPNTSKEHARRAIEMKFQEWLVESGNVQQLNDLVNFKLQ